MAAAGAQIPTMVYHQALGELTRAKQTLAVTGTHGKSSTTSMLAHIFVAAGFDPTALVGAPVPAWGGQNARVGKSPWFIVEADEYRDHFLALHAESAIITAIDFDHPDFFASLADVEESFSEFVSRLSTTGILIVPQAVVNQFPNIAWPAATRAVAAPTKPIDLVLPGAHMQFNAWLAIQLARHYGIDEQTARAALKEYPGLGRRFEQVGSLHNMTVISDYGHHPAEIAATLRAARERYPDRQILVIFEAHTPERLIQFGQAFAQALSLAEGVVLAPPFIPAGRSDALSGVSEALAALAQKLVEAGRAVQVAPDLPTLGRIMEDLAPAYDVAIAFSAGSVDSWLRTFVKQK
jgi:UDP-N-acetylmuramate--alanine ligase